MSIFQKLQRLSMSCKRWGVKRRSLPESKKHLAAQGLSPRWLAAHHSLHWTSQVSPVVQNYLPVQGCKGRGFAPWVGKTPWNRKWQPALVFLPGKSHEQRSRVGSSPRGQKNQTQQSTHALFTPSCLVDFTEVFTGMNDSVLNPCSSHKLLSNLIPSRQFCLSYDAVISQWSRVILGPL